MGIPLNDKGFPYLDKPVMQAIFDCVYGVHEHLKPGTLHLLEEQQFEDFIRLLLTFQDFNSRYRFEQLAELFPVFENTVGPMEINSDGTTYWLALGLSLQELYGLRTATLRRLLMHLKG